jgi:hypothetical protein
MRVIYDIRLTVGLICARGQSVLTVNNVKMSSSYLSYCTYIIVYKFSVEAETNWNHLIKTDKLQCILSKMQICTEVQHCCRII